MTKIKLCGLRRECDIDYVNELMPDYVGFVFWQKSKRNVDFETARTLRQRLNGGIKAVGVFVNETTQNIAYLVNEGIIDMIQLHGSEDNDYIKELRKKVSCPVVQAFQIRSAEDIEAAKISAADYIMLDSGTGSGMTFDHSLIKGIDRKFFLAGGLDSENVYDKILLYAPFAVDASSSLETYGVKDKDKMTAFVKAVRKDKIQ